MKLKRKSVVSLAIASVIVITFAIGTLTAFADYEVVPDTMHQSADEFALVYADYVVRQFQFSPSREGFLEAGFEPVIGNSIDELFARNAFADLNEYEIESLMNGSINIYSKTIWSPSH